jgi:hypothetical protein
MKFKVVGLLAMVAVVVAGVLVIPAQRVEAMGSNPATLVAINQLNTDNATVVNATARNNVAMYTRSMLAYYNMFSGAISDSNVCQQSTYLGSSLKVMARTGALTPAEFTTLFADNNAVRATLLVRACAPLT